MVKQSRKLEIIAALVVATLIAVLIALVLIVWWYHQIYKQITMFQLDMISQTLALLQLAIMGSTSVIPPSL